MGSIPGTRGVRYMADDVTQEESFHQELSFPLQ